jgi:hypothetical protein
MSTLQLLQEIVKDVTAVLGALSLLFTALSHLPWFPPRVLELFARLGLATSKFSVNKRPPGDPEGPKSSGASAGVGLGVLFLVACFASGAATGCALFSPADYAHCLPQPSALLADVAQILKGPDYEKKLADLALTKTEAAVICAVQQFVDLLQGKIGASPDDAASVAHGKAYLAKASAK